MSYRLKLLFVTCLTCTSLAPSALAGVPLQSQRLVRDDIRVDRPLGETRIALDGSAARQEQQMAAAPPTTATPASTHPSPATVPVSAASPTPAAPPSSPPPGSPLKDWIWWGAIGLIPISIVAAALYILYPKERQQKSATSNIKVHPFKAASSKLAATSAEQTHEADQIRIETSEDSKFKEAANGDRAIESSQDHLAISSTTRLSKVDIVETLIHDLHNPAPSQRRKAIWELGQRGDSRAIQPLVDLLVDADSNQRGLILAAVTEISMRALKPMNRALMLAIQDSSPDVRKNALRDVTRIFELVTQTSQLLQYVASDADAEVQETAEWALGQLHRVRPIFKSEEMPSFSPQNGCINNAPYCFSSLTENANSEGPLSLQDEPETLEGG